MTSPIEPIAAEVGARASPMLIEQEANMMLMSIAVSLKRIADAITHQPVGDYNLHDYIGKIANKQDC